MTVFKNIPRKEPTTKSPESKWKRFHYCYFCVKSFKNVTRCFFPTLFIK